jgi:Cu/Ag efflux protein CusF
MRNNLGIWRTCSTKLAGVCTLNVLVLLGGPGGCDQGQPGTKSNESNGKGGRAEASTVVPDVYVVRGIIKQLPKAGDPRSSFAVHHEPIPTFKGKEGTVVGMAEMTMDFPLGPGVSTDGLVIGQKVELIFEVLTGPSMKYYVTKISPLAAETVLELKSGG